MNSLSERINSRDINYSDIEKMMELTSAAMFGKFVDEIEEQIEITILGMNSMEKFTEADNNLRKFCIAHNFPSPNSLIDDESNMEPDTEIRKVYFGLELLGENGIIYQKKQTIHKKVEQIIKKYASQTDSEEIYFHDSAEFSKYVEQNSLKKHKDVLSEAIAIYEDKSSVNIDMVLTPDMIIPVIKKKVKRGILYEQVASEHIIEEIKAEEKEKYGLNREILLSYRGVSTTITGFKRREYQDAINLSTKIHENQAMIDEITKERHAILYT